MFEKEAEEHCNEVLCAVCENPSCTEHLKCREWRDRRAGFYCGAEYGYNKANEWHDLRKDPNDLPSENKEYIVAYIGAKGSYCADKICSSEEYFDAEVMRWRSRDTLEDLPYLNNNDNVVLAWCEVPTFKGE